MKTVVTEFLMETSFTGMINIIDTSQIKRNLQLTVQLLELNVPIIIGFKHDGCSYSTWFKD